MNLLAITGSLRKDSFNTQLLRAVKELAPKEMTIEIVTLMACRSAMPMRKQARRAGEREGPSGKGKTG